MTIQDFRLVENEYRDRLKGVQILLSSTQAGPGRKVKQEQEEISRNHVPRLFLGSVYYAALLPFPPFASALCYVLRLRIRVMHDDAISV